MLAERFQQLVGSSPMQYLTQWRMLLAANLLCRSNAPLARIAEDVGYQTDTAFSRAFRREYGAPPAAWRRNRIGESRWFTEAAGGGRRARARYSAGRGCRTQSWTEGRAHCALA